MLAHTKAFGSFSVNNIAAAKKFYGQTLGLKLESEFMGEDRQEILGLTFENGTRMMIYPKEDHTPATYTVLNFEVKDLESEVSELKKKGVQFEHYDGNDENEISHQDGVDIAWFKDPAGNFLSVVKEVS